MNASVLEVRLPLSLTQLVGHGRRPELVSHPLLQVGAPLRAFLKDGQR